MDAQPFDPAVVGKNIAFERGRKGWTQENLAHSAHLDLRSVGSAERGSRTTRLVTIQKIASALGVRFEELVEDRARKSGAPIDVDQKLAHLISLHEQQHPAVNIDVSRYICDLRRQILKISDQGFENDEMEQLFKQEIKNFCITAEINNFLVMQDNNNEEEVLCACSAMADHGLVAYVRDSGWQLLLACMGKAAKNVRLDLKRHLLINDGLVGSSSDLQTLSNIIAKHHRNGVRVSLVDSPSLPAVLLPKRNMAVFGDGYVLRATDTIAWDLEGSSDKHDVGYSHDQFQEMARFVKWESVSLDLDLSTIQKDLSHIWKIPKL